MNFSTIYTETIWKFKEDWNLKKGSLISKEDLIALRPCPKDAISPSKLNKILGKKLKRNKKNGDYLSVNDI